MKKPYKHDELSDIVCEEPGCRARIKKNVVVRKKQSGKTNRFLCYEHFMLKHRKEQNADKSNRSTGV